MENVSSLTLSLASFSSSFVAFGKLLGTFFRLVRNVRGFVSRAWFLEYMISKEFGGFFFTIFLTGDAESARCLVCASSSDSSSETFSLLTVDLLTNGCRSGAGDLGFLGFLGRVPYIAPLLGNDEDVGSLCLTEATRRLLASGRDFSFISFSLVNANKDPV